MIFKTTCNKLQLLSVLFLFAITTLTQAQTTTQITSDNFEEGYGVWNNGGANSEILYSGWSSCLNGSSGNKSVRLRNGNSSSKLTSNPYNFSNYSYVTITYNYATNDKMENNEGWFIEYSDDNGSNWETIKQYRSGDNFTKNICVSDEEVTITPSSTINFNSSQILVRFRNNSNRDDEQLWLDNIVVKGIFTAIAPIANFSADNTTTFTGDVVSFTDESENNPASWAWSFINSANVTFVNGTSASSQNPQVTFSAAGLYTVTLIATNSIDSDTITKIDYITVVTAIDNPASFTVNQSTNNPYTFLDLAATANTDKDNILVAYNTTNSFGMPTRDSGNNIILNGDGTIIFEGNANAINSNTLPQLNQDTPYYFKAWSVTAESFSRGIEANATTAAVLRPVSLAVTASTINNSTTFNAEANNLNNNLMLVYSTSNNFGTPQDGVFYQKDDSIGNATVLLSSVDVNAINNYIHDLLQLDTRYYYRIYSIATGIWYYSQDYREDDDITIEGFIWQNNIDGDNPNRFNPFTNGDQVIDNITVSGISRGDGVDGNDDDDDYEAIGWSEAGTLDISRNQYFEFTLTPDNGYEINFKEFFFNAGDKNGDLDFVFRSSIDNYASNIGDVLNSDDGGTNIDLTGNGFQNISEAITFRIYGWNATENDTEFRIRDFGFKGTLSEYTTWNGTSWDKIPNLGMKAILNGDYNTKVGGEQTSFRSKSLKVNSGYTLTVDDNTFVEVNYDTFGEGNIVVETKGAFVQRNDGEFNLNGTSKVNKSTPYKDQWYYYTYWSSPVKDFNIESIFWSIGGKFYFDGRAWQYATGRIMAPGQGFITRADDAGVQTASFSGEFNTGTITTPIVYDATNNVKTNLIGNPYPSSINLDQFLETNKDVIEGIAYFWSQETAPVGGQFDASDYIPYNLTGSTSTSTDNTRIVNGFVPSAQSFFTISKAAGNATFTNDMRMADATSNSQFFKSSNNAPPKGLESKAEKLWVNLSSSNGVFSQILVGYIDGATNEDDGLTYDAIKFNEAAGAFLYSTIVNSDKKYVIQGKDVNSINVDEAIALGFKTTVATSYTISIAKLEGDFINGNTIYLKDNMLNIIHDLSANDYTFNSEVGEFNNRFEIVFKSIALSTNSFETETNDLKIVELNDNVIQFSVPNSTSISKVTVFDLLGKHIIDLKGTSSTEKYQFNSLTSSIYIAKVTLNDGVVITKKFIKK